MYLTQAFQQVEGIPLYRYQLQLRLARALDLLDQYDDCRRSASTSAFPATATSVPRSARPIGARPRSSSSPPCIARNALMKSR